MEGRMRNRNERPTMQRAHPMAPNVVRLSLRKKCDRMAQMTTERAPMGVCGIVVENRTSQ
jgi:hypothetical protein